MKHGNSIFLSLPSLILGVGSCVFFLSSGCSDQDITTSQLREMNARIDGLTKKIEESEQRNADASSEIGDLRRALDEVKVAAEDTVKRANQRLTREQLQASLDAFLESNWKEIEAQEIPSGSTFTGKSDPVLHMPDAMDFPYSATMIITTERGPNTVRQDLVLKADADGNWKMPGKFESVVPEPKPGNLDPSGSGKSAPAAPPIPPGIPPGGTKVVDITKESREQQPPTPATPPVNPLASPTLGPSQPPIPDASNPPSSGKSPPAVPAGLAIPPGGTKEIDLRSRSGGSGQP